MAAYVIAIRDSTTDATELAEYSRQAAAARLPGMKALVAYGKFKVLEGEPIEGAVLLEFPTFEDAQAWYDSPAYQQAKEHRLKGANYRFILLEGL